MANAGPCARALRLVALSLPVLLLGAGLAQPHTLTLDGHRDAEYVLLATDPAADLAATFDNVATTHFAELSELYVYTDTTNLYVYVPLPNYSPISASGEIGLAIDTTGDVPSSGGASDPRTLAITYAYTATHANAGTIPLTTTNIILPDILIRGDVYGTTLDDRGVTAFQHWNGSAWIVDALNWGGITTGNASGATGTHVAYASGLGVEFFIPYADLAAPPETPLHLQFFTTRHTDLNTTGAMDTVPSDDQATAVNDSTQQHRLASLVPAAPPSPCAGAALGDSSVVTAGLAHDSTSPADRDPPGALLPGASATLRLRACAGDLEGVDLLVWSKDDPAASSPTQTLALSATVAGDYAFWSGAVAAPLAGGDQWYQFRLTDGGAAGYFRPVSASPGPGQWSASLQAPAWLLPTLPGQTLFIPLVVKP